VVLDALPRTVSDKVDRQALPAPAPTRPNSKELDAAIQSDVEKVLAEIWVKVLQLDNVRASDDFFKLGGHSLLAVQIVSRVRDAFRVELPLRTLFDCPTIAEQALVVEELIGNQVESRWD
jgi:acyl carrier protein